MLDRLKKMKYVACLQDWVANTASPYYQSLSKREKYVLWFASVFLPLVLFINMVVLPLNHAKQQRHQSLLVLQEQVQKAEQMAETLQKKKPLHISKLPMTIVADVARQLQIQQFIKRMKPQLSNQKKQRLLIQMRSMPYRKAVLFLNALSKQGLLLLHVNMQKDKLPGLVHLQMIIE